MTLTIIISLIITGLILLILEILVFPGTTVVGLIGFVLIVFGVYNAYAVLGSFYGHITLLSSLSLSGVALYFSLRANTWKRVMLNNELEGKVNVIEEGKITVGQTGKTLSRLAPMGNALFDNEVYEVTSKEGFIDNDKDIVVAKIDGNKIYVKLKL